MALLDFQLQVHDGLFDDAELEGFARLQVADHEEHLDGLRVAQDTALIVLGSFDGLIFPLLLNIDLWSAVNFILWGPFGLHVAAFFHHGYLVTVVAVVCDGHR